MPGLPDSPATCSALCGWATTTTPTIGRSKARTCRGAHLGRVHEEGRPVAAVFDTKDFTPPDGVQMVSIDKVTNLLSGRSLPRRLRGRVPRRHRAHRHMRPSAGSTAIFCRSCSASVTSLRHAKTKMESLLDRASSIRRCRCRPAWAGSAGTRRLRAHPALNRRRTARRSAGRARPRARKPTGSQSDRIHGWCASAGLERDDRSPESSSTLALKQSARWLSRSALFGARSADLAERDSTP